jgi:hypothetical protein
VSKVGPLALMLRSVNFSNRAYVSTAPRRLRPTLARALAGPGRILAACPKRGLKLAYLWMLCLEAWLDAITRWGAGARDFKLAEGTMLDPSPKTPKAVISARFRGFCAVHRVNEK